MASSQSSKAQKAAEEENIVTLDEAIKLAQGHHSIGNLLLAERTYRDILRAVPDHYPTVHYLGILLFQSRNYNEAEELLDKATRADPDNADCWSNYGALLAQNQKFEKALGVFERALSVKPDHVDALNNRAYVLWALERYEESEKMALELLENHPENIPALINLGMSQAMLDKHDKSIETWQKASEIAPDNPSVWTNWGHTLREMGRIAASEAPCRKAVELDPKNPEALNNLGNTLRDLGDIAAAVDCYREATNIKPNFYQAHNNMAAAYIDEDSYKEAVIAARYAVAFKDDFAEGYNSLAKALVGLGDYEEAHKVAQRAVQLQSDVSDAYLNLADVLLRADRYDDGHAALEEAIKLEPDSARCYLRLAELKDLTNKVDEAIEAIDKALEYAPDMPVILLTKARILIGSNHVPEAIEIIDHVIEIAPQMLNARQMKAEALISINENEEARAILQELLEINPRMPGLYHTLRSLKKFKSEDDEDFQTMLSLAEELKDGGLEQRASIYFSISEAYEHMEKYDESFECLKKANDSKRKIIPYDSSKLLPTYEGLKHIFSPAFLEKYAGTGDESHIPVFIVGMPRSGTTLTEQIISSHPDVYGAGELNYLPSIRTSLRGPLADMDMKALGKKYVERVVGRDPGKHKHITDKMPANYMNIGLIAAILPNAKIIHCMRNPIDTCLSCYKQNFMRGQYWSYNLEEMAAEYKRYLDLMAYWRELLPGRFIEIQYEETVSDFENQARRLIDYIGLPWNDNCLEPHKQKRAVLTASKAQVTKPVYKSSVEKWRKFEKHLQPLVRELLPVEAA